MNPTTSKTMLAACAVVCVLFAGRAFSAEYQWVHTAEATHNWNDPANWTSGEGEGFPNAPGDIAIFDNAFAGKQTVNLRQDITIGRLVLAGSGGNVTLQNSGSETFTLTFDNNLSNAEIELGTEGTITHSINAGVRLASDLDINLSGIDAGNRHGITLNRVFDLNGRTLTLTGGVDEQKQCSFENNADFTNGTIINNSKSPIAVSGRKSFPGTIILNTKASSGTNSGAMTCISGGWTNVAEIVVNGVITDSRVNSGAWLHCGSGSPYAENPSLRLSVTKLTLNGGAVAYVGQPATVGSANDWQQGLEWYEENIKILNLQSAHNFFELGKGNNSAGTRLHFNEIIRERGVSMYIRGKYTNNNIERERQLLTDNYADIVVGADGATNTTFMSVVPWISMYATGGFSSVGGLAVYDESEGFRLLDGGEYITVFADATIEDNMRANANAAFHSTDLAINSLSVFGNNNNVLRNGMTLSIASGALFFSGGQTLGSAGNTSGSVINFGSVEGIITVPSTSSAQIGYSLAGTDGISKVQTGTLTLTALNDELSGPVHVGGGILRIGNGTNPSNLGASDTVDIHAGATLQISSDDAIHDDAFIHVRSLVDGLYNGTINIDEGCTERVKCLFLGGEGQSAGTFGSSESSAAFVDDNHFTGKGVLVVTHDFNYDNKRTILIIR